MFDFSVFLQPICNYVPTSLVTFLHMGMNTVVCKYRVVSVIPILSFLLQKFDLEK
jgi:hypothetical protein